MQDRRRILSSCCAIFIAAAFSFEAHVGVAAESGTVLTGKAAMGDWTKDAPGVRRKITVQDLPPASSNALAINLPRVADARQTLDFEYRPVSRLTFMLMVSAIRASYLLRQMATSLSWKVTPIKFVYCAIQRRVAGLTPMKSSPNTT
jgi:hypothetical protein